MDADLPYEPANPLEKLCCNVRNLITLILVFGLILNSCILYRLNNQSSDRKSIEDLINGTNIRLTHLINETSIAMLTRFQELNQKEEEEINKNKKNIESLKLQSKKTLEQLQNLREKEEHNLLEIYQSKRKILSLEFNSSVMSDELKNLSKVEKHDHQENKNMTGSLGLVLKQINRSLTEEINQFKNRGVLDQLYPIGSIYITFTAKEPPMNNQSGVVWEPLPEGSTLMTADKHNVGRQSGEVRLDGGSTEGHALSVEEMPSHGHNYTRYNEDSEEIYAGIWVKRRIPYVTKSYTTSSSGSNKAHSHQLNVTNHKVMVWRRLS